MQVVNERSGFEFSAEFEDADGAPTLPASVHWNLWCEASQKQLRDFTQVSPVAVAGTDGITRYIVTIDVPSSLNAIQYPRNASEQKKLLVVANKDQPSEFSIEHAYVVRNLRGRE